MPEMTGGQAVVAALKAAGVKAVFSLPGVHTLPIFDALIDEPSIRNIVVRHEQAAAFMADGYARTTGEIGVALVTTGPGGGNTMTALIEAYGSSSPVMVISSQIASDMIGKGKGVLHEVKDQLGMFRSVTCWNKQVEDIADIPVSIYQAAKRLKTGRPRPVHLDIPEDMLRDSADVEIMAENFGRPGGDPAKVRAAAERLAGAERPVIYAGGGANASGAGAELLRLAEILTAPVVTSTMGKGVVPDDHPLVLGCLRRNRLLAEMVAGADVVLAVGTRFSESATRSWTVTFPPGLIHVDIDEDEIGNNYPVEVGIVGDARTVVRQILDTIDKGQLPDSSGRMKEVESIEERIQEYATSKYPGQVQLMNDIREVLDRDGIMVVDATSISYWTGGHFRALEPRTCLHPWGSATLGFALPAALGAKAAYPHRQVIALMGDGGFMFCANELATAVQHGLNVVTLVFNDHCYGVIKRLQMGAFGRHSGAELVNPDFVKLAEAFGALGLGVSSWGEVKTALEEALRSGMPAIIDIPTSQEADLVP